MILRVDPFSAAIAILGIIVSVLEASGVRVISPAPSGPETQIVWTPEEYRTLCLEARERHPACPKEGLLEPKE